MTWATAAADVDSWPSVVAVIITVIGGLAAILLKQRSNEQKIERADDRIVEVQKTVESVDAQVHGNDGGRSMRDDLGQALRLMGIVKDAVEKLQDQDLRLIRNDVSRLSGDVQLLRTEIIQERTARLSLVKLVERPAATNGHTSIEQ